MLPRPTLEREVGGEGAPKGGGMDHRMGDVRTLCWLKKVRKGAQQGTRRSRDWRTAGDVTTKQPSRVDLPSFDVYVCVCMCVFNMCVVASCITFEVGKHLVLVIDRAPELSWVWFGLNGN